MAVTAVSSHKPFFDGLVEGSVSEEELSRYVSKMSLEDRVSQVFMTFFYGQTFGKEQRHFFDRCGVDNVIFMGWANPTTSSRCIRQLNRGLRDYVVKKREIPPLIASDKEGGRVDRPYSKTLTNFPGNQALALGEDPEVAFRVGEAVGQEMAFCGFNLILAPVVDVIGVKGHFLGSRSFGSDPEVVAKFSERMVSGLQSGGVGAVAKHFIATGASAPNPHYEVPVVGDSLETLRKRDYVPFQNVAGKVDAVMTSHVVVKALDSERVATLSKNALDEVLREEMKFQGVVVSDSMMMNGILKKRGNYYEAIESVKQATVEAFNAGCDLLLLAAFEWLETRPTAEEDEDAIVEIVEHFKGAVRGGEVSEERLNEAVERVLRMKANIEKRKGPYLTYSLNEHTQLALQVANGALQKVSGGVEGRLENRNFTVLAPLRVGIHVTDALDFIHLDPFQKHFLSPWSYEDVKYGMTLKERVMNDMSASGLTFFFTYGLKEDKEQRELLEYLYREGKGRLVVVGLGDPEEVKEFGEVVERAIYVTHSLSTPSIQALFKEFIP